MFRGLGWKEEHVIKHPWHEVVTAVQNKYPNPYNNSVLSSDVISRHVDGIHGSIHTVRLLKTSFPKISHMRDLIGLEYSSIHKDQKRLHMVTQNADLRSMLRAVEKIDYQEHPDNKNWTLLKHSTTIEGFPLVAHTASSFSRKTAGQGREALLWVIQHRLPVLHSYPQWNRILSDSSSLVAPTHVQQISETSVSHEPSGSNMFPMLEENSMSPVPSPIQPRFFADRVPQDSGTTVSNVDSPVLRLGSHFETLTRDVTAISDALLRRSQRVARMFSRVDEYVLIL